MAAPSARHERSPLLPTEFLQQDDIAEVEAAAAVEISASEVAVAAPHLRKGLRHALGTLAFGALLVLGYLGRGGSLRMTPMGSDGGRPRQGFIARTSLAGNGTDALIELDGMGLTGKAHDDKNRRNRKASFIVLGDWGFDYNDHGNVKPECQKAVARKMLEKFEELGDVKFIINVGDSFYPNGVRSKSDHQWERKWRAVYAKKLRSVPWYSVYGNHDYHNDGCACASHHGHCAQHNADIHNHRYFFMPNFSYSVHHPEYDLEVLGLELNNFQYKGYWDEDWNDWVPHHFNDCKWTRCPGHCRENAKQHAKEAFELFHHRRHHSPARNLLVFSHYPLNWFDEAPHFIEGLRDQSKRITYFGGHTHDVNKKHSHTIHPNVGWLVGGGGGWSCDGGRQGFVVGTINHRNEVHTHSVLVPWWDCCDW
mmetsp:Transcript_116899/g.303080  ORF Transcript_116899/g.303080 Transcript_116899/m.303080 type:complete len:423 (-) Transcript_116899:202-1470(-)